VCRYAKYGDVSTKVDVYAFGVVLYELISAKEAVVRANDSGTESKGLIVLVSLLDIPVITLTPLPLLGLCILLRL
jgi:hypothetical protein